MKLKNLKKKSKIIFLGDYIDRGPDSKGVLDFLINLRDTDIIEHIFLLGNHELFLLDSYDEEVYSEETFNNWLRNGGIETLKSFAILPVYEIFLEKFNYSYISWLKSRNDYFHIDGDYLFAHATYSSHIDFNNINDYDKMTLLWGRNREGIKDGKYFLVCGHTPRRDLQVYGGDKFVSIDLGLVNHLREC